MAARCSSSVCISLILSLLIIKTSQNSRQKRQIFADQPRIITENGHLVFQSGTNHNITFRSGSGGGIMIDNIDLKATATQIRSNKAAIDRLQGTTGNVPQSSVIQRLTTLESQMGQVTSVPATLQTLQSNFNSFRTQTTSSSASVISRLNQVETRLNNGGGGSNSLTTQLLNFQQQLHQLSNTVNNLQHSLDTRITTNTNSRRQNQRRLRRVRTRLTQMRNRVDNLNRLLTVNECTSSPCLNGGTCVDLFNGFMCQCPSNWMGQRCDQDVNECSEFAGTVQGCQNGASCRNTQGSFSCQCTSGWHGIHCSTRQNDCDSASHYELCGHGTCINDRRPGPGQQANYRCLCQTGWRNDSSNPACFTDVNECATGRHCSFDPHVMCINTPGSFTCGSCPAGYTGNGFVCRDINECLVNNGGCSQNPAVTCINTRGSSTCGSCPSGFTGNGRSCEYNDDGVCGTNHGGCHPDAQCTNTPNIYQRCSCPTGQVGNGIGPNGCQTSGCTPNPCQHGGSCQSFTPGLVHCFCIPPWTGDNCQVLQANPCDPNPCQNGGTCQSVYTSSHFVCACPSTFTGTLCQDESSGCGGQLRAPSGSISYPPTVGTNYPHGATCAWTISLTSTNKVVNLYFTRFHLEYDSGCVFDSLTVRDGASADSDQIGVYCGTSLPNGGFINSTGNAIYLLFQSDASFAGGGFDLTWNSTSPMCGGTLLGNEGSIQSPGFPNNYQHNVDCVWIVRVTPGNVIRFVFSQLAIESHHSCGYDYLEIHDGLTDQSPVLNRYCTSSAPEPIQTTGPYAYVHFHTDGSTSDRGFSLTYSMPTDSEGHQSGCGNDYHAASGTVTSPNFPNDYTNNLDCVWRITNPYGQSIRLEFTAFTVEDFSDCGWDYLEVSDVSNNSSTSLGRFCGETLPAPINSIGSSITLTLRTDSSVVHQGFSASWSTGCNQFFPGPTGQISSPGFPNNYPANADCRYVIRVAEGKRVRFQFEAFTIGSAGSDITGTQCSGHYVEFYNGDTVSSDQRIGQRYCRQFRPEDMIRSSGRTMLIRFVSDSSNNQPSLAFTGTFTEETASTLCGGVFTGRNGIVSSPGFPNTYPTGLNCTWYITVDPGFVVRLAFSFLQLPSRSLGECSDYVEVYDNSTISADSRLGRFCGSVVPAVLTSTDNSMVITMRTGTAIGLQGFRALYRGLNVTTSCGRELTESTGVITSPGYPQNYPHGRDCSWVIRSSGHGIHISLNFTDFALEDGGDDCIYDHVDIRDGPTAFSPRLRKICGQRTIRPPIMSSGSALYIHFHSDGGMSMRGFRLEYDATSTGCGAAFTSPTGTIISPNYPLPYYHNARCTWTITVSRGSRVTLSFQDFDLESHSRCGFDSLTIRDNDEAGAALTNGTNRVCGTNSPGTVTSRSNRVWIQLMTDYSLAGRGFLLHYHQNCTNHLTALHGVIETPNFPHAYPHMANCTWVIEAPNSNTINVTFAAFDLETPYQGCQYDHLQIRDGSRSTSPLLHDFCGTTIPAPFQSPTNLLFLNFKSDYSVAPNGFRLEYIFDGCGGIITSNTGRLTSPNYPQRYTHMMECVWRITVDLDKSIKLTINDLDIEPGRNCIYDVLEVYAGEDMTAPRIAQLCHTQTSSQHFTVSGNTMLVRFKSDGSVTGGGFNANFEAISGGCGGSFNSSAGIIHSPGWPNSLDAGTCEWLVTVSPGGVAVLNFTDFNIYGYGNCAYMDSLKIYDGQNSSTPLLATLCGRNLPAVVRSTKTNQLFLKLQTRSLRNNRGFKLQYSTGCGGLIIPEVTSVISTPGYPSDVEYGTECDWTIRSRDVANRVSITFTHMDIRSFNNCNDAYVTVHQGGDPSVDNRYCGTSVPATIMSFGNELVVQFKTRWTNKGFRAVVSASSSDCGGDLSADSGRFNSPNYPDDYPINVECVWRLRASPGNSISLSFPLFSLSSNGNVNTDYLEVRTPDVNGQLVGRWIDSNAPTNLTALGGAWIKFRSDDTQPGQGFRAEWNSVYGGSFQADSGQVASPRYPMDYPPHYADYQWTITVSPYRVVNLTFSHFDLEYSGSCEYADFVEIYDGTQETGDSFGMYCGRQIPGPFITTTNVATLVFHSDGSMAKSGFLANWTAVSITGPTATPDGCGGELSVTETEQELVYPVNNTNYQNSEDCEWTLVAQPGSNVRINITFIDLERHGSCRYDYLTFSDGGSSSFSKYCGRVEPQDPIIVSGNGGKIIFHTDISMRHTGFRLTYKKDCGGYFSRLTSAQIKSPHFPGNYPNNANCSWQVWVRPGKTIKLDFDPTFSISDSGSCDNDYLQLLNGFGSDAPPLFLNTSTTNTNGRYCGTTAPPSLETSSRYLKVDFNTDDSGTSQGFSFNFTEKSIACGGHIRLTHDSRFTYITSPNYPENYPHTVECVWVIIGPGLERIKVEFEGTFYIERHGSCVFDYVMFRDGGTSYSPTLGQKACGQHLPSSVVSTGSILYMRFAADTSVSHAGFKARVSIATCGGRFTASSGEVTSPNYPQPYASNLDCEWYITVPVGHTVKITKVIVDMQNTVNCTGDVLEVRETNSTGYLLGSGCGEGTVIPRIMETADNKAYVRFKTDGSTARPGFKLSFNASTEVCGGTLTTSSGSFTSPNYPRPYAHRRFCYWEIRVAEGRRITLTFDDFDLEAHSRCRYDYLAVYNGVFPRSPLISRHCGSGSMQPVESSGNSMRVVFRSDFSESGRGFRVSYTSDQEAFCGGVLSDPIGNITNPGFQQHQYNHSVQCIWRIHNPNPINSSLALKFTHMHLEQGTQCRFDSVILREGQNWNSPEINRYCGENVPADYIYVATPDVFVVFQSDVSVSGDGFRLEYAVHDCGGVLTQPGVISSPNYPSNYDHNDHCVWRIVAPEGTRIRVHFADFSFENHTMCGFDWVQIFNGGLPDSPSNAKRCGPNVPDDFTSQGNQIKIVMETDYSFAARGFQMQFSFSSGGCGGLYHSSTGDLSSPNHPSSYPHNVECRWDINVPVGYTVRLRFNPPFDLEAADCRYDHVEVFDSYGNGTLTNLGRWCSNSNPPVQISSTSRMVVVFRSDSNTNGNGFSASWESVCGGLFEQERGTIYSPNYPRLYENDMNCVYKIRPPGVRQILINFRDFELEGPAGNCSYDNLSITEINGRRRNQLGLFCGNAVPERIVGRDSIEVRLRTDGGFNSKGFRLNYYTRECGGVLTDPNGYISSGFRGSNYSHNMNCIWNITVAENNIIAFKFRTFDLEDDTRCGYDYVALYDGPDLNSPLLGKYCGDIRSVPNVIKTTGNQMVIRFRTDPSIAHGGFQSSYWTTYGPNHGCGGTLRQSSGSLTSFDADNDGLYEDGLDCAWTIVTEINMVLSLNITDFNIENVHDCIYDSLSIYDGPSTDHPSLGKYCGSTIPGVVRSSGNSLLVVFSTDSSVVYPGFNATFTSQPALCGGSYNTTNDPQTITSIGYPNPYQMSLRCSWILDAGLGGQIRVNITDLQLATDTNCENEYLQIRDLPVGETSQDHHYCGSRLPQPFDSRGHLVQIFYHLNQGSTGRGFRLTHQIADCNKEFRGSSGRMTSPNFPGMYPHSTTCNVNVTSPPNTFLSFYFNLLQIEPHPSCGYDFLQIRNSSSDEVAKLCGFYTPPPVHLPNNMATLQFLTDISSRGRGYDITYIASTIGPGCGGEVVGVRSGVLTSPDFPVYSNVSQTCTWTVKPPARTTLFYTLSRRTLPLPDGAEADCVHNRLVIMEANNQGNEVRMRGDFCTTDESQNDETWSSNKDTTITFTNRDGSAPVFQFSFSDTPPSPLQGR